MWLCRGCIDAVASVATPESYSRELHTQLIKRLSAQKWQSTTVCEVSSLDLHDIGTDQWIEQRYEVAGAAWFKTAVGDIAMAMPLDIRRFVYRKAQDDLDPLMTGFRVRVKVRASYGQLKDAVDELSGIVRRMSVFYLAKVKSEMAIACLCFLDKPNVTTTGQGYLRVILGVQLCDIKATSVSALVGMLPELAESR
jgi:hypothetical protein